MWKSILFFGCSLLFSGSALATYKLSPNNIVQNASFETFTGFPHMVSPWIGERALMSGWPNAPEGVDYVTVDANIYQDLATTPGQLYQVSFFMAGDLYFGPSATVQVSWGGQGLAMFTTQPHPYDPTQNRSLQIVWEQFSLPLIANTAITRLDIEVASGTEFYLDAVEVVPIPEPSISLLTLLAGIMTATKCERRGATANQNG